MVGDRGRVEPRVTHRAERLPRVAPPVRELGVVVQVGVDQRVARQQRRAPTGAVRVDRRGIEQPTHVVLRDRRSAIPSVSQPGSSLSGGHPLQRSGVNRSKVPRRRPVCPPKRSFSPHSGNSSSRLATDASSIGQTKRLPDLVDDPPRVVPDVVDGEPQDLPTFVHQRVLSAAVALERVAAAVRPKAIDLDDELGCGPREISSGNEPAALANHELRRATAPPTRSPLRIHEDPPGTPGRCRRPHGPAGSPPEGARDPCAPIAQARRLRSISGG